MKNLLGICVLLTLACAPVQVCSPPPVAECAGRHTFIRTTREATVRWPAEILPLLLTPTPGAEKWAQYLEHETRRLNAELGFTAAIVAPLYTGGAEELYKASTSGIVPMFVSDEFDKPVTRLQWDAASGRVYLVYMTLPPIEEYSEIAWAPIIRHELGHVLGLDHDQCPGALMNPVWSEYNPTDSWFDPTDLEALRAAYGPL